MKEEHKQILDFIGSYLNSNPEMRFGQALFNLRINEFEDIKFNRPGELSLRDIYNDSDEKILGRMWLGDNIERELDIE